MKDYEIITILPSDGSAFEAAKKDVVAILKRNNVEVVKEDDWGVRKLASPIERLEAAHFLLQTCKADPSKLKAVTHELGLQQSVVRFMVARVA